MFAGESDLGTVALIAGVAAAVVLSSLLKRPGIGVILALILVAAFWAIPGGLGVIGLDAPDSWIATLLSAIVIGTAIALLTIVVIDPLTERVNGSVHDHSIVDGVRGNLRGLLTWIALVWIVVALVEELIFRGFLMSAGIRILGDDLVAVVAVVVATSILFGLAHLYQGPAGALSTGIVGAMLGAIFAWSGFNLWLPIGVHGVIDTVSLVLMYGGHDRRLGRLIVDSERPTPVAGLGE